MTLRLTKHHGLGNDFLVVLDLDGRHRIDAGLASALCDRHRGIGADGLIRVTAGQTLGFELYNADGSSAEMSGNGMRCLAQVVLDAGLVKAGEPFDVMTPAGPKRVTVRPTDAAGTVWASVEMGQARVEGEANRCNVGHGQLLVDLGNPHLVVLGPDPATIPVAELGPALEATAPNTHGINVEFVSLGPGPDEITMRVWERGVGETLACGTGACAAVVAMHHWGRVGTEVTVHQPGGPAAVELGPDSTVVLSGPSVKIADVEVDPATITAHEGVSR